MTDTAIRQMYTNAAANLFGCSYTDIPSYGRHTNLINSDPSTPVSYGVLTLLSSVPRLSRFTAADSDHQPCGCSLYPNIRNTIFTHLSSKHGVRYRRLFVCFIQNCMSTPLLQTLSVSGSLTLSAVLKFKAVLLVMEFVSLVRD